MRALEEGRLEPTPEVTAHLDGCLGCRACESACPSGVPYGSLIEAARPYVEEHRPRAQRLARRALGKALTDARLRALAAAPLRLLAGRDWTKRLARRTGSPWLAYAAALPRPTATRRPLPESLEPERTPRGTAVLLTGCVAETSFPETAEAIARLLVHAGVRVLVPRAQGCCGALSLHLGDDARARALAGDLAALAARTGADWFVSTAAGCGALLREYDALLPNREDAARVSHGARDALALLAELGLPPAKRAIERRVAVHDPCHLVHAQGVSGEVRRLLAGIPGLELVDLAESDFCCGSAGTYNLTERALAQRLLARKLANVERSGADVVAAANPGCLLQIRAGAIARGLPIDVAHPIELLAIAHLD
jgi:glycolate oxidase iron-sulfur subunit